MNTALGQGENRVDSFSVDFTKEQIYLAGKAYPKGFFANAVLNISQKEMTDLLRIAAPIFHFHQDLLGIRYSDEGFDSAKRATLELKEHLFKIMPFCLLDLNLEATRLNFAFAEETKVYLKEFCNISPAEEKDVERSKDFAAVYQFLLSVLNFYVYIPMDFYNFKTAIINLEGLFLRNLEVRDSNHYALACNKFFSDPHLPALLFGAQVTPAVHGFTLKPNVQQEYVTLLNPECPDEMNIGQRMHFCRMMDFLVTDFFEGLQIGHAPKQCAVCGRYFLTTNARPRKYCDDYAPNDPRGRTCQQVGARKQRSERERADDHPVKIICEKRCNTINHHLRSGKIDAEFATKAKALARNKRDRALRDHNYYVSEYENEMTQEAIYTQTEQILGRPPTTQCAYV